MMETEQVMGDVEGGNDQEQNRIDRLAELAIGASDIKKYVLCAVVPTVPSIHCSNEEKLTMLRRMKDAGFHTLTSVMMKTKKQLMSVKGMSEPKIDKVRDAAMRLCGFGFISGVVARQKRDQIMKITTGCTQLDEVLGGGIETASLTEAYGTYHPPPSERANERLLTVCSYRRVPMRQDADVAHILRYGAATAR